MYNEPIYVSHIEKWLDLLKRKVMDRYSSEGTVLNYELRAAQARPVPCSRPHPPAWHRAV